MCVYLLCVECDEQEKVEEDVLRISARRTYLQ